MFNNVLLVPTRKKPDHNCIGKFIQVGEDNRYAYAARSGRLQIIGFTTDEYYDLHFFKVDIKHVAEAFLLGLEMRSIGESK